MPRFEHPDQLCLDVLDPVDKARREAWIKRGCGFYLGPDQPHPNCSFPDCRACYPYWQKKYGLQAWWPRRKGSP